MLNIELSKEPRAVLNWAEKVCETCQDSVVLETAGQPDICVRCQLKRADKDHFMAFGWKISVMRNQIVASRIADV